MKNIAIIIICLIFFQNAIGQYSDSCKSNNFDESLFRTINGNRTKFLDVVFKVLNESMLPVSIALPTVLFTYSRLNQNYYDENTSVLTGLSLVSTTISGTLIKFIFKRERPYTTLKCVNIDKSDIPFDRYSFPSLHSANSFAIATSLTLRYPDKPVLITGMYLYALLVSYARPYAGVHYPSDVLAGAFLGTANAILVFSLRKEIIDVKNNLFRESGREDKNSSVLFTSFVFGGIVTSEIINHYLIKSENKIFNKTSTSVSQTGDINWFNCSISF